MKRVMVIGCSGSGKSTLARKLHKITGIRLIHLDQYYWKPDWVETADAIWDQRVTMLAAQPEWIMDGNYGRTMDIRLKRADAIIYLDYSTIRCLWRITKRILKYYGKVRPDMTEYCTERFNWDFYHHVLTFNMLRRKKTYKKLSELDKAVKVTILKNDHSVARYLRKLEASYYSM